jgi:large subunit ribosomal protein L19
MGLYIQHNDTKFQVGDTVKVSQKIVEGGKERVQAFEGLVIAVSGHAGEKMFTVRKISTGIGVERIWPIDSPFIQKIEVISQGIVRRSKLYYLRNRTGRLALKVTPKFATKVVKNAANTKTATKPVKAKAARKTGRKTSPKASSK